MHPGLICLNASAMTASLQVALFQQALREIKIQAITDLMNQVIEVDFDAKLDQVTVTVYEAPA
jgi:hypothetical protein